MKSTPERPFEFGSSRMPRIVWLALAAFFLGSALCPFNPPVDDRSNSVKDGKYMNTAAESSTNIENEHLKAVSMSQEIETATFALG
jgi:hypothetical protein